MDFKIATKSQAPTRKGTLDLPVVHFFATKQRMVHGMSRSIDIRYEDTKGNETKIEIRPPYYLLGTQQTSKKFWSIPRLKEIGIERLTILGETDPVYFWGWDEMTVLGREIELLGKNLESIDFYSETKAEWLSHLTFCYRLLIASTPRECTPKLGIG